MNKNAWEQLADLEVFSEYHRLIRRIFGMGVWLMAPDAQRGQALGAGPKRLLFCDIIQHQPGGKPRCLECDASHARRVAKSRLPIRYRCHAGLTEFMIPIVIGGEVIAHLVSGKVLDHRPSAAVRRRMRRRLARSEHDQRQLWTAYRQLPVIPPPKQKDLLSLLQVFANYVAATHARLVLLEKSPADRIMTQAMAFMKPRLGEPISRSQLAAAAGTSKRNLTRVFRARTGGTVLDCLQRLRIDDACRQLQESRATIGQIGLASGFGSIQQFNRVFRKLIGNTPRTWRAKAQRLAGAHG